MTAPAVSRGTKPALAVVPDPPAATYADIELDLIDVEDNVRADVGELDELASSIQLLGVIQAIKVTLQPDGRYRLVWGQRRVLASRQVGLQRIPAIVLPPSELDAHGARRSIEQLSENLQRKDLNPIEEAIALREVLDADPDLTMEALADRLAMSRPWVSNTVALLEAAPAVQAHVREGRLTASHVKALRGLAPKTQVELATIAIERGSSAHGLEDLVQGHKRSEEWRKEQEARTRRDREERTTRYAASIDKKLGKEPRNVKIVVERYGMGDATVAVTALEKAGLTNVTLAQAGVASRPKGGVCNCAGWRVETTYQGLVIAPGCFVSKHQLAAGKVDDEARQMLHELEQRVHARLTATAGEQVLIGDGGIHLSPFLARMALWGMRTTDEWAVQILGYGVSDWAVEHGGKRNAAWATLTALPIEKVASELGRLITRDFRDQYGYRVDWPAVAELIGEPIEPPKAKRSKADGPIRGEDLEPASIEELAEAGVDVAIDDEAPS